jgi:hypothetical protein
MGTDCVFCRELNFLYRSEEMQESKGRTVYCRILILDNGPGAGRAQSVLRLGTGWTVRGSNPGEGEIFRTRSEDPWGLSNLLQNEHRVSFQRVKR